MILNNYSTQANLVLVVYLIVGLYIMTINYKKQKNLLGNILLLGIVTGYALLLSYDINCLIKGQCVTWSWIKAISLVLGPLLMFIAMNMDKNLERFINKK